MNTRNTYQWPKTPPSLTASKLLAREEWMSYWHRKLSNDSSLNYLEKFNQGWVTTLPLPREDPCRTLEIGSGIGGHLNFENLERQEYYCLDLRPAFCQEIKERYTHGHIKVICANIEHGVPMEAAYFDRAVAIHVLEHLPNLPKALEEIKRLLKPSGVFDVVIPVEGGWAYGITRSLTTARLFKKRFKIRYDEIMATEHVNSYKEIIFCLKEIGFRVVDMKKFPVNSLPCSWNLCLGFRLQYQ